MAANQKIAELTEIVQCRLGNGFTVTIENRAMDGVAIIECPIENRYARVLAYFPAIDGRRKLDPKLADHIVFVAAQKFKAGASNHRYTEQARADSDAAYDAMCRVIDEKTRVLAHQS